ncbi:hypothetical protein Salat_1149900 [Sesamum alatum]|uniref:Uncharacterized protein n=1 Tax=Sesamum alatum TaxID=300844 RepID=A0AAE1YFA6_9LAMI|nr:hypothetical protein Salat_1149900 [Sesamum alatum]
MNRPTFPTAPHPPFKPLAPLVTIFLLYYDDLSDPRGVEPTVQAVGSFIAIVGMLEHHPPLSFRQIFTSPLFSCSFSLSDLQIEPQHPSWLPPRDFCSAVQGFLISPSSGVSHTASPSDSKPWCAQTPPIPSDLRFAHLRGSCRRTHPSSVPSEPSLF